MEKKSTISHKKLLLVTFYGLFFLKSGETFSYQISNEHDCINCQQSISSNNLTVIKDELQMMMEPVQAISGVNHDEIKRPKYPNDSGQVIDDAGHPLLKSIVQMKIDYIVLDSEDNYTFETKICTGFLLKSDVLATAKHCLNPEGSEKVFAIRVVCTLGKSDKRFSDVQELDFSEGLGIELNNKLTSSQKLSLSQKRNLKKRLGLARIGSLSKGLQQDFSVLDLGRHKLDFTMIKLAAPFKKAIPISLLPEKHDLVFKNAHLPDDKDKLIKVQYFGFSTDTDSGKSGEVLTYDNLFNNYLSPLNDLKSIRNRNDSIAPGFVYPGQSGGPIIIWTEDDNGQETPYIAGMILGTLSFENDPYLFGAKRVRFENVKNFREIALENLP